MAANSRPSRRRRRVLPRTTDLIAFLAGRDPATRRAAVEMMSYSDRLGLDSDWPSWAHDGQLSPAAADGDEAWRTWVIMAGRGFGKTRAGSQWVTEAVRGGDKQPAPVKIALVGATIDEARRVMVEGVSGLLAIAQPWVAEWAPSRRLLRFANGSEATLFSGASPDALRGPEHHLAWCDELAKWDRPQETWDMLTLGLRLGPHPRALVTTTPGGAAALTTILAAPGCVVTGGATWANPHLPRAFVDTVTGLYGGTRMGAQELEGKLVDPAGALWTRAMLEGCRLDEDSPPCQGGVGVGASEASLSADASDARASNPVAADPPPAPPCQGGESVTPFLKQTWPTFPPREPHEYERIAIGVDPPVGGGTCGIVVCARDHDGHGHVLADHSIGDCSPERWARAVAEAAAHYPVPLVVAEANQGGEMV